MEAARRLMIACLAALACVLALPAVASAAKPLWLCKPGLDDNPCEPKLRTTLLSPSGEEQGTKKVKRAKRRRVDCFYVYPTVTEGPAPQAPLEVVPVLRSIALYQAARFSQRCRVFAPVYRQLTLAGIGGGATQEMVEQAYADVRNAWRKYLEKHNRERGVVLIGHSQGSVHLVRLVAEEIDPRRKLRRKLLSALLLGWNLTVAKGQDAGGDFERVEACRSRKQLGCVVAYSTYDAPVPDGAPFGRAGQPGLEVLCANPAALGGGSAALDTIHPTEPFAPGTIRAAIDAVGLTQPSVSTPWAEYRGAYSGRCSSADDANVLQLTGAPGAPDLNAVPPSWGLHLVDVNIALGNLVNLVRKQAKRFANKRG